MSHSAEKCNRGTVWDLLTYIQLQNIKKLEGGTLWGYLEFFEKKAHSAKKNRKGGGGSLVPSGFVGYVQNVKKKQRGPFRIS